MPVCERHRAETLLRCGRCEKPICPDCALMGPVGARCRDCAALRGSHLYQVAPGQVLAAGAAMACCAVAAGWLLAAAPLGYLGAFWLMVLAGGGAGELALRAGGRKRGTAMEAAAGAGAALGVAAGLLGEALQASGEQWLAWLAAGLDVKLLGAGVFVAAAFLRIRRI